MLDENSKKRLEEALYKKALGYSYLEESEEYSLIDGELRLTKRKTATKETPPDLSAIKLLLDSAIDDSLNMTEEELIKERDRLIRLLSSPAN